MTSAAIRRVASPSPEELIGRAREMVSEIRALAEETERNRTISPHIIGKIRDAELLRTCRPKEFGGYEIRRRRRARDCAGDLGGLCVDRLDDERSPLQRHLLRPFSGRGAARIMGRRRRPVYLRLLCPDRDCGSR